MRPEGPLRLHLAVGGVVASTWAATTGGGGLEPASLLVHEAVVWLAAALAASLPGTARPRVRGLGAALVGSMLVSAWRSPVPFAALDRWAFWATAIVLGWTVVRLGAAESILTGRDGAPARTWRRAALATTGGWIALQAAGLAGWPLGGRAGTTITGRPLGTFADPNHLTEAATLLAAMHAALAMARRPGRGVHAVLAGVLAAGALATGSRTAPVALLALAGVLGVAHLRRTARPELRRRLGMALLGIAGVLAVVTSLVVARRWNEPDAWTRPRIWAAVAPAVLERPAFGLGPGAFVHAHHRWNFPEARGLGRFEKRPTSAHGEWLRLPLEVGAVGCVLLVAFAVSVARRRAAALAPLAAAVAPFALLHDVLHPPSFGALLAVAIGVVLADAGPEPGAPEGPIWSPALPDRFFAGALGGALLVAGLAVRPWLAHEALRSRADDALPAALLLNPRHAGAWVQRARTLSEGRDALTARRLAAADRALEEAARWSALDPEPVRERARLAARGAALVPSRDRALRLFVEAAELDPTNVFVLAEAADVARRGGRWGIALRLAERALELEPDFTDARALRALALQGAGEVDEARSAAADLRSHLERVARVGAAVSTYQRRLVEGHGLLVQRALAVLGDAEPASP